MTLDDLVSQSAPAGKSSQPSVSSKSSAPVTSLDKLIAASKGSAQPAQDPVKNAMSPEAVKANSTGGIIKNTLLGLPRAALDEAKSIGKGFGEFALSAGEAIPRLVSPKTSTAVLPPTKVPGLGALGPLQSFQSQAAQKVQDGSSVPGAIAKGTLDTVLNDPLGVAFKPALVGLGALGKVLAKNKAAKDEMAALLERAASIKSGETTSEFQDMTLPERLAATGEKKLPVMGDTTLRKLPIAGESVDKSILIANKYTKPDELPTIEAGTVPKAKGELPAIQMVSPAKSGGELSYHPIDSLIEKSKPQTPVEAPTSPVATPKEPPASIPSEKSVATPQAQIKASTTETSTGGTKISGVAKDIQTKAIENGLISEYKDTAQFESRNIKEQAQKISDIIAKDPEDLGRMIRGEIPVPKDISPSYLVTAADKYATKNGDGKLLQDLISSRLTGEGSMHASELRMLGERDSSSAMKALKEIQTARETEAASRLQGKTVAKAKRETARAIKEEVKKAVPKKEDWNSFITNLTC